MTSVKKVRAHRKFCRKFEANLEIVHRRNVRLTSELMPVKHGKVEWIDRDRTEDSNVKFMIFTLPYALQFEAINNFIYFILHILRNLI